MSDRLSHLADPHLILRRPCMSTPCPAGSIFPYFDLDAGDEV